MFEFARFRSFVCLASSGLALLLGAKANAQPVLNDPNLEAVPFISALNQPVTFAFLDANQMFLCEKASGQVKYFVNGVLIGVVLDLAVNSASERGLLGIALDPSFAKNPKVYLYWSQDSTGGDTLNASNVALLANRVDAFDWNGVTLTFSHNLLQLRSFQADAGQPVRGNHNGGSMRFGPDGKLYVLQGDTGRRGYTQNNLQGPVPDDPFGGPAPDAAHTTGVMYRINKDGTSPADNPFFNTTPYPNMNKVFGYGIRNGFGLMFDIATGHLWLQEHGDDTFDEMNIIRAGHNGGWIQTMGPLSRVAQFRDIEINLNTGGLQQLRWPPTMIQTSPVLAYKRMVHFKGSHYAEPKFSWKYAVAPGGIAFVDTSSLGPEYQGDMIMGESRTTLLNGYLMKFEMNPARDAFAFSDSRLNDLVADNFAKFDPIESESLIMGSNFGVVTDIATSPGGRVFLVCLDRGIVYELRRRV